MQTFLVPQGIQIQIGIVGPQMQGGVLYPGRASQVQILNFSDRAELIPVGNQVPIK